MANDITTLSYIRFEHITQCRKKEDESLNSGRRAVKGGGIRNYHDSTLEWRGVEGEERAGEREGEAEENSWSSSS